MILRRFSRSHWFQLSGILSSYLAVLVGVFWIKNGFAAVLLYHLTLTVCMIAINRSKAFTLLRSGFHGYIGLILCLGGLIPGVVILLLWPSAKLPAVDLSELMNIVNLTHTSLILFAVYSCVVNPVLEEAFWRGCFMPRSWKPGPIDALFAGYHCLLLLAVVKPVFVLLSFFALMSVGWIFRNIYRITGGLAIPFITHLIADIAILFAVWKIMY